MAAVQVGGDDDDGRYEYVTLPTTVDGAAAKLHLKLAFHDDATSDDGGRKPDVLRACAVVFAATREDLSGVYEGYVARDRAAVASRYWMMNRTAAATDRDDESSVAAAVGVWSQDARDALIGRRNGDADATAAEYVHVLRRLEADENRSSVLEMSWKLKLRPVGMVTLGTIRLSAPLPLSAAFPERVSDLFVEPMIRALRGARGRRERADREAAENVELLSADNRRLLDTLRTADGSRRRNERQLMARFLEVLNAKKLRLAALQREIAELKRYRPSDAVPTLVVDEPTRRVTTNRRRGRAARRVAAGRAVSRGCRKTEWVHATGLERLDADKVAAKKTRYGNDDWRSVFPGEEERSVDDVIAESRPTDDVQQQQPDAMETDNVGFVNNDGVDVVDAETVSPEAVKSTVEDDIFNADTQIDDLNMQESSNDSLPFFQEQVDVRSTTVVNASALPNKKDDQPQPKQKSVLDDLWSGIL